MSALNVLCGRVQGLRPAGAASIEVRLDCGGVPILASVTRRSCEALGLLPGLQVYAIVKTVALDRQSLGRGALAYGRGRDDPADA
jgi:molybdate transport system ATP-binding protein